MKLSGDVVIPEEKLTRYLLVPRMWDDKSKFLAQGGFLAGNPDELKRAIANLAKNAEAVQDGVNEYGVFFRTDGELAGSDGRTLSVTAIWMRRKVDDKVYFVTLMPRKERKP